MIKRARKSTPPEVNVRLTTSDSQSVTTASDTWFSQYLVAY